MLKTLILAVSALQLCGAQSVQHAAQGLQYKGTGPTPLPIVPAASRPIQAPPFNYFGESRCDSDGNMYFHSGDSGFRAGRIFELSSDGSTGKFFQPSGKLAYSEAAGFQSFWVTQDGEVFTLASGNDGVFVYQFDRDGAVKDSVALQVPKGVQVADFATFDNGSSLVWGYYTQEAAKQLRGRRYQAIFTASGEMLKDLPIGGPNVDFNNPALTDGAAAIARGNLYFVGPDKITVISPSGDTVRTLRFHKPDPEIAVTKVYVSSGVVVIALFKISSNQQLSRRFLVLDENSGEMMGYYQPSPELGGRDACFTRNRELVFLGMADNRQNQTVVTARIP